MSQLRTGQAIVTINSARVIAADAAVDWSSVVANHRFSVPATGNPAAYANGVLYVIASTVAPNVSQSGKWELNLSAPFQKQSGTVFYAIHRDFRPVLGTPIWNHGDVDTLLLLNLLGDKVEDAAGIGKEPVIEPGEPTEFLAGDKTMKALRADYVGFTQAGTGAVARTVEARLRDFPFTVKDFGAVGDGVNDDTSAIQAAIDAAQSTGMKRRLIMPAGKYRTTDTIHLGYGHPNFSSIVFEGEGYMFRPVDTSAFNGSAIIADFSDRPCINFQGARGSVIRGIALSGKLKDHIAGNNMGINDPAAIDDTNPANWVDPTLSATQDSRYAPYAGISIDAYAGVRPAISYPNVNYPASMGAVAQYGKRFSSDVLIEDMFITGFNVAIVNQPCDADGNGDFTTIRRCYIERCKWAVSVGNTQARNTHLMGLKVSRVYAAMTNRTHGRGSGKFAGAIIDLSIFGAINLIDMGGFFAQPMTFINFYGESLWRIGTLLASSTNENSVVFIGSEFNFGGQNDGRGVPARVFEGGGQPMDLQFIGCTFHGYPSVFTINQPGAAFRGCFCRQDNRPNAYERFAHNALAGGLVTYQLANPREGRLKTQYYNLASGVKDPVPIFTGPIQPNATRDRCATIYSDRIAAASDPDAVPVRVPWLVSTISKAAFASSTLVGKTLTFTFASRSEFQFAAFGPLPGDVLWDDATSSVFFVRSRDGLTVIAELQNNYKSNGSGGYVTMVPIVLNTGSYYVANSRVYTPSYFLRGDVTAGSGTLTNCARDDGFSEFFNADIAVDDWMLVRDREDRWITPASARITARDQATQTISLLNSAGTRTQVRRRLDLFIRQPPANV